MGKRSHFHAYHDLKYHLVLVTKYRNKVINKPIMERLFEIVREQSEKWDIDVLEINAECDHVHMLIHAHPSVDLSKYINSIKTVSSRLIRKEFKPHVDTFYWKPYFWSRAYCLLSVGGAPLETIKKYIESQHSPS
jgi:putative transposase